MNPTQDTLHEALVPSPELLNLCPGLPDVVAGQRVLYDLGRREVYRMPTTAERASGVSPVKSDALLQLVPCSSDTLVVHCRAIRKEWSVFSDHWRPLFGRNAHVLLLEDFTRRFYTCGVASLGTTLADTVDRIRQLAAALGCTRIVTCGSSAGGTGALLIGAALGAKRMLALSPITTFETGFYTSDPMSSPDSNQVRSRLLRLPKIIPEQARADLRTVLAQLQPGQEARVHYPTKMHWDTRWAQHLKGMSGIKLVAHKEAVKHNLLTQGETEQSFLRAEIEGFILAGATPAMAPAEAATT